MAMNVESKFVMNTIFFSTPIDEMILEKGQVTLTQKKSFEIQVAISVIIAIWKNK